MLDTTVQMNKEYDTSNLLIFYFFFIYMNGVYHSRLINKWCMKKDNIYLSRACKKYKDKMMRYNCHETTLQERPNDVLV